MKRFANLKSYDNLFTLQQSEIVEKLLKFSLFHGLESNKDVINELTQLMKKETFQTRDLIIDENSKDDRMFFLLNGQVVINKTEANGQIVVIARTDDSTHPFFGESILLEKFHKNANVVAYSICHCLSLSSVNFDCFLKAHPSVGAIIYKNLASLIFDRLTKANRDLLLAGLTV